MPENYHDHGTSEPGTWVLVVAGVLMLFMVTGIAMSVTGNFSWWLMGLWIGLAALVVIVLPLWSAAFLEPEQAETAPIEESHYE